MISIAVIGTMGSGKSDVALVLEKYFSDKGHTVRIVDSYTKEINDLGYETDFASNYVINGLVMSNRVMAEMRAESELKGLQKDADPAMMVSHPPVIITVGTPVDTLAYQAIYVQRLAREYNGEPIMRQELNVNEMAVLFFGYNVINTYNYDVTIKLALPDLMPDDDDVWREEHDNSLSEILTKYRIPYIEMAADSDAAVGTTVEKIIARKQD